MITARSRVRHTSARRDRWDVRRAPALLAAAVVRLSLSPKQSAAFMKQRLNVTRPLVPSGRGAVELVDSLAGVA